MPTPVADDSSEIWPRLMRLRRICFSKINLPVADCWCRGALVDSNGNIIDAPCTDAREPTAFDLLGKPGTAQDSAETPDSSKLAASFDGQSIDTVKFLNSMIELWSKVEPQTHVNEYGLLWIKYP